MGDLLKSLAGPTQMGMGGAATALGNQAGPMMMANGLNQTMQQMAQPQQPPPQPHPMQPSGNPATTPPAPAVQTPQAPQPMAMPTSGGPPNGPVTERQYPPYGPPNSGTSGLPPQLLAMLMQTMGQGRG